MYKGYLVSYNGKQVKITLNAGSRQGAKHVEYTDGTFDILDDDTLLDVITTDNSNEHIL